MNTLKLLPLVLLLSTALQAQKSNSHNGPSYTVNHKSISMLYGVSTLFQVAPFIKSNNGIDNSGSFAVGPFSVLYNKGLTKNISLYLGPTAMFYRDKYKYANGSVIDGQSNMILLGVLAGFNYHFATSHMVDPYIGTGAGVGYYTSSSGADQASLRLKGEVPILYNAKLGINIYNKQSNAWTLEAGYDYLAYVKVGYTYVFSN